MDERTDMADENSSDGDHYGLDLVLMLVVTILVGVLAGEHWRMLLEGLTALSVVGAIIVGYARLKS